METSAIRPTATIVHDPSPRRDETTGSPVATDLPTEKTVRPARAAAEVRPTDDRRAEQDRTNRPAVKTGFERDLPSGSIVYRWTDETTDRVILEIPRSDKVRSQKLYQSRADETADRTVDRSV